MRSTAPALGLVASIALALAGCGDSTEVTCGPGTVASGDTCIPTGASGPGTGGGTPTGGTGGTPTGGGGGSTTPYDGGAPGSDSGYSTSPPGSTGTRPPPGCDVAAGECTTWANELVAGLSARQTAAGCAMPSTVDPRIAGVAQRHAEYQASVDRIDASSPDGPLFDQIVAAGVRFGDAAALFSQTRSGAEDVLDRWAANPDAAVHLARCGDLIGVGVSTSADGDSYVTLLMAR